jgi:uncharacterized lipoprotein YajG
MAYKRKAITEALCPFYYRKCKVRKCTEPPSTSDNSEWQNQVSRLGSCPNAGVTLTKQDYQSHQYLAVVEK